MLLKGNTLKICRKYNVNHLELIFEQLSLEYEKNCKKTKTKKNSSTLSKTKLKKKSWMSEFFGPGHTKDDTLCSTMTTQKEGGKCIIISIFLIGLKQPPCS